MANVCFVHFDDTAKLVHVALDERGVDATAHIQGI
jgi:hypothetical protein